MINQKGTYIYTDITDNALSVTAELSPLFGAH